jgi:hypothetical protein
VVEGGRGLPIDPLAPAWLLVRADADGGPWYPSLGELVSRPDGSWRTTLDLDGPPNQQYRVVVGTVDGPTQMALVHHLAAGRDQPLDELPAGFHEEASVVVVRQ